MTHLSLRRCQQCDNLVTRLFPLSHESGRDLKVCAECYGLGLALQKGAATPCKRSA